MFEAVELGQKVDKEVFEREVEGLRAQLVEAQRGLTTSRSSMIVIVSGVEGAGKSDVVNRLHAWLDPRGLRTHAFFEETEGERCRPNYWRFWRCLPPRGTIGVLFGSWYTRPIVARALGEIEEAEFERQLRRAAEFEHMLSLDGAKIVKLWFHLSKDDQGKRLAKHLGGKGAGKKGAGKKGAGKKGNGKKGNGKKGKKKDGDPLSATLRSYADSYDRFAAVSERAIRLTDSGAAPWHLIESTDRRHRDLRAGQIVLEALREIGAAKPAEKPPAEPAPPPPERTVLDQVDLEEAIEPEAYEREFERLRERLRALAWKAHERHTSTVVVFEGWDAAGKGGAIRRLTGAMDARLYRVIPVAAPTDEERAQHYLWRFWRHIPRGGYVSVYDRSWYGRVLVERVEGFARQDEWQQAYKEINDFEEQLSEGGICVVKFWLHLSPEEQLRRFKEREVTPYKQHKITAEDWRNRDRWPAYLGAVNDMVVRTSTACAPWTLVAANSKLIARLQIMRTVAERLETVLD